VIDGGELAVDGKIVYSEALFNGSALAAGVSFGSLGAAVIDDSAEASDVNNAFVVLSSVEWPTETALTAADITALSNWTGNKRLILSGENTPSGNLDVSAKGKLEIAADLILNGNYTLKGSSSGAGNITVAEGGSIVLGHTDAKLEGGIKVNGKISMGNFTLGTAIPATVDLSAGALASTASTAAFNLAGSAWEIGALEMGGSLTITGATGLTVGTLKNTAVGTLTLPNIPVSVNLVETISPAGGLITVAGAGDAAGSLTVGTVTGATGLTLTAGSVKVGTINIAAGSNITTTALTPFGTVADLASNKVTGAGTVDLGSTALEITAAALTFGPHIKTTGGVTLTKDATFNQGLTAATNGVVNTGAGTTVTLTLNGADSTLATLTSAVTAQKLILAGNGKVTVGGAVIATGDLEVTSAGAVSFAVADQANTIAGAKSLIVGSNSSVKAGQYLTFGPGTYTAGTGFSYGNSVLKAGAENNTLTLGSSGIVLKGGDGNASFTASVGMVTLNSTAGSIIVSPEAILTFGVADLALGNGVVAVGEGGQIALVEGSKISGFSNTALDTATADGDLEGATVKGPVNGGFTTYLGGFTVSNSTLTLGSGTLTGGAGGASYTGKATGGGVLTKASVIGTQA
jgi:fibronectin-binding autotransporter adhesin